MGDAEGIICQTIQAPVLPLDYASESDEDEQPPGGFVVDTIGANPAESTTDPVEQSKLNSQDNSGAWKSAEASAITVSQAAVNDTNDTLSQVSLPAGHQSSATVTSPLALLPQSKQQLSNSSCTTAAESTRATPAEGQPTVVATDTGSAVQLGDEATAPHADYCSDASDE